MSEARNITHEESMAAAICNALWQIAVMREIMDKLSDGASDEEGLPPTWFNWFGQRINEVGEALDRSRWPSRARL